MSKEDKISKQFKNKLNIDSSSEYDLDCWESFLNHLIESGSINSDEGFKLYWLIKERVMGSIQCGQRLRDWYFQELENRSFPRALTKCRQEATTSVNIDSDQSSPDIFEISVSEFEDDQRPAHRDSRKRIADETIELDDSLEIVEIDSPSLPREKKQKVSIKYLFDDDEYSDVSSDEDNCF